MTAQLIEASDHFFNIYFYTANRYKREQNVVCLAVCPGLFSDIHTCRASMVPDPPTHNICAQDLHTRPAHQACALTPHIMQEVHANTYYTSPLHDASFGNAKNVLRATL